MPCDQSPDLTREHLALVTDVPTGRPFHITVGSPDGEVAWRVAIRPLLPEEQPLTVEG